MKNFAVALAVVMTIMAGSSCSFFGGKCQPEKWEYLLEDVSDVKNVILMIGDGMGPEQIKAGEIYKGEKLIFQNFPYKVQVNTDSWVGVTDSAAAATAMATGRLTYNGLVGLNFRTYLDEEPVELETIVDIASSMGKRTGVLTTEVLYGATPMGFSAHSASRNNTEELLESAARNSNVNLFASETFSSSYNSIFTKNCYTQISNVADISDATQEKIFGSYNIKATAKSMTAGDNVAFDYLVTAFPDRYRCCALHAKVALIWNDQWHLSVVGSQNATNNPKLERGIIHTSQDVFFFDFKTLSHEFDRGTT